MTNEEEITRAQDAKFILDNYLYQDAWKQIKEGIVNAMNQSTMGDEKTHTRLVMALQITNKLQKHFEQAMETGKLAELQLMDKKKRLWGLVK